MIKKKAPIKIIRREKVEYISRDKYEKVDPLSLTRLHRPFEGQRYISVKDSSYSEGRKRLKTRTYEKFLEDQTTRSEQRVINIYKKLKKELKRNPSHEEIRKESEGTGTKEGGAISWEVIYKYTEKHNLPLTKLRGGLAEEIKTVYSALKKKLHRKPYVSEVMEKVTLDKGEGPNAKNNKRTNIKKVLEKAGLKLTSGKPK